MPTAPLSKTYETQNSLILSAPGVLVHYVPGVDVSLFDKNHFTPCTMFLIIA